MSLSKNASGCSGNLNKQREYESKDSMEQDNQMNGECICLNTPLSNTTYIVNKANSTLTQMERTGRVEEGKPKVMNMQKLTRGYKKNHQQKMV